MNPCHPPSRRARTMAGRKHNGLLAVVALSILTLGATARAGNLTRSSMSNTPVSGAAATSQTSTAATTAAYQSAQSSAFAKSAQLSLQHSLQALQALQAAQNAARATALTATTSVPDGLNVGGLVPTGSTVSSINPNSELIPVTITNNTASQISVSQGGTVNLPNGTGNDMVTITGTGSVTTASGSTPFSGTVTEALPAGSSITLSSKGTVGYASGAQSSISATVPSDIANFATSGVSVSNWTGIGGISQATTSAATPAVVVTIDQTQQQALLSWQSFNIGKNTTLEFNQSAGGQNVGQWVAINQVASSIAPTQVLGAIQAPGQVYVINQNGVIFNGSSQVNAGALVASSLALNPSYITNGLLNDAANDYQFQFSSLLATETQTTGVGIHRLTTTTVAPLWTSPSAIPSGVTATVASVPTGDITVEAGAQLSSPSVNGQGGRIALIAPNVTNDGTISTPDGQTILAAGLQVGFSAHSSADTSLRGLDVYVGQVTAPSASLPSATFTFNGLPNNDELTLSGSGQVGTYTPPGGTATPLIAGTPTAVPIGSSVSLNGGTENFAAITSGQAGTVTDAANTLDGQGNIITPGGDIEATEADVMLTGANVNQLGIINGSTSVTLNGRIDLLADYNAAAVSAGGTTGFYPFASGTVNLGGQSVTQVVPEVSSSATITGTQLAVSSLVNIQGQSIEMFPGSLLYAPSANQPSSSSSAALDLVGTELTNGVTLNAGSWTPSGSLTIFTDNGTLSLDTGSTIDVSGEENVSASVAEDVIAVQLRSTELANSPLERNGALRGSTVYVDIRNVGVYDGTPWVGTPLGNVSGYVNDVERTVGELTSSGGTVALNAAQATVSSGATINVSGGWINYTGATVPVTQVITSGGAILSIAQATPNLVYEGLETPLTLSSAKWGVSQTYATGLETSSQYEPGYLQGGSGGKVTLTAPAMTMSGKLYGNTVNGTLQQTPASTLNATYSGATFLPTTLAISAIPQASSLVLDFAQNSSSSGASESTSPNILFQSDAYISQNTPAANQMFLSQDIVNNDGFSLNIDTSASGTIVVPAGINLTTAIGGGITLAAANIDLEGSLFAPDGSLSFTVKDISPAESQSSGSSTPTADPTRGQFTLGSGATLSTDGLIVDNRLTAAAPYSLPLAIGGGTVSIAALDVALDPGSTIDVSGGVAVSASGKVAYGNAGSISIFGGEDAQLKSLVSGGSVELGSTLSGYSGNIGGGGSLTIQAPLVQVGGAQLLNGDNSTSAFVAGEASVTSNGTTLWLDKATATGQPASTDFFSEGGFGSFTIEGLGQIETNSNGDVFSAGGDPVISPAVFIAANTNITPVSQNSIVELGNKLSIAVQSVAAESQLLPSERTPINLTFNAEGVTSTLSGDAPPEAGGGVYNNNNGGGGLQVRGDLVVGAGAVIQTDPQTNSSHGVSLLAANGTIAVLGQIVAPGGTITVHGGNTTSLNDNQLLFYDSSPENPFPTVDLGPNSILSTAGATEQTLNTLGYDTGTVLAGGNIVITGNIVAESGAVLNVSGASAVLDQTQNSLGLGTTAIGTAAYVPTLVTSNGGSISLNATQLLYSDATLLGTAGGATAQGGSLSVSAGFAQTVNPSILPSEPQDITLIVSQQGLNGGYCLPPGGATGQGLLDGQPILGSDSAIGATVNTSIGGEPVYSYFAVSPNLFIASSPDTAPSDNGGHAGGFGSLSLAGTLSFLGPVNITTSNSISLAHSSGNADSGATGGVIYADAPVTITAPYVALNAYEASYLPDQVTGYPGASAATGTSTGALTVNASVLANVGNLSLQDINTLTFNANPAHGGDIQGDGTLQVAGQINLNAGQIYPPTEATFTIQASDISITAPTGQALPSLPLSAGGTLNLEATTIEQDGVLRAPFGVINLGTSATQSITFSSGSITSVSAVDPTTGEGITIPYGIVDQNGNWYDPLGNNITTTGPPAKAINVSGASIDLASGATIDLRGGGDLMAYQFSAGTGGTTDILASTGGSFSSNSFAVLPGYSLGYAPDGTYADATNLETNSVADAGYFNSSLAVGEQVFLNASSGLPAGVYTLLPARYALLPGAHLVTAESGAASGATLVEPVGSSLVSGYVTSSLATTTSPVDQPFLVSAQSVVLNQAPYTIESANTFFAKNASASNRTASLLPVDAGQLVLNATQTMTVLGSVLSQAAPGGFGGQVDITSTEPIYILGPNSTAPAGALALNSSQLTSFGAASLLIGGVRTTTDTGTSVEVTTPDLVVDNSGASTVIDGQTVDGLAAPDIILVSNGTLDIAPDSVIEQFGQLSGNAQALTLQGDGVLLRVSSDVSAQVSRQNVTPDTTSALTIGAGAMIVNAGGGAVGSLTLDSTNLVNISTATNAVPVLSSDALALDSGFINFELSAPVTPPTTGLVVTNTQLQSLLSSTQSLAFLSYSSIALYGSGSIGGATVNSSNQITAYQENSLSLHADAIYYADTPDSSAGITINAQTVSLDNLSGGTLLPSLGGLGNGGNLTINAKTISLGSNAMQIDQFSAVELNASDSILLKGLGAQVAAGVATTTGSDVTPTPASFSVAGNLVLTTPLITGASTPDQAVTSTTTTAPDELVQASGVLTLAGPTTSADPGTLGASLTLIGSSITQSGGKVVLHSGTIDLQATGPAGTGNITVEGTLDASGKAQPTYGLISYTSGGQIDLDSSSGLVTIGTGGLINVSAVSGSGMAGSGAGNGGSVTVTAAQTFTTGAGQIEGAGGVVTQSGSVLYQGNGGSFTLDVGSLDPSGVGQGLLSSIEPGLTGFGRQTIRDRNDSTVTVDDTITTGSFNLSADQGSIVVAGTINASDVVAADPNGNLIQIGGTIDLAAGGSVTLDSTAVLNVSGPSLNNAGEGGSVSLAAGTYEGTSNATSSAAIDLVTGSQINLAVDGGPGGTLYLVAPQVSGGTYVTGATYTTVAVNAANGGSPTDVAIAPIDSTVVQNAANIVVEGLYVQDALSSSDLIDNYEATAESNASNFMANASTLQGRIFGSNTVTSEIEPAEEIDNSVGSLELQNSWDLSQFRYQDGALTVPGALIIRAAGDINIDFGASLSDGFDTSASGSVNNLNPLLAVGSSSWSYTIVAGADFTAGNSGAVASSASLQQSGLGGTLQVGYQNTASPVYLPENGVNSDSTYFQTIRTGTGSITIDAGGDVLLLNNLATIYTAGSQVDPTDGGLFTAPSGYSDSDRVQLPATYSSGGGNVSVSARGDIAHEAYDANGTSLALLPDSSDELPTNWLDREGSAGTPTTWWVDFTNFFEGVGALGGGNVTLAAGGSVINVDAAVPTNARLINGQLLQLGGGDLAVSAGNNIDAGVYSTESGNITLTAGNDIQTNATRAAVKLGQPSTPADWLPTSYFLGRGNLSIAAGGSVLLGGVANPFLLPQSSNNVTSSTATGQSTELSYFDTYGQFDTVTATSLAGDVTIKASSDGTDQGSLYNWYSNLLDSPVTSHNGVEIASVDPWLTLAQTYTTTGNIDFFGPATVPAISPGNVFEGFTALYPSSLVVTSFSGDIDLLGGLTLSPAATGNLDLVAQGSVNAFQVNEVNTVGTVSQWGSGLINISDTDPANLPGPASPINTYVQLSNLDPYFVETGVTEGLTLQQKQNLHADIDGSTLHAGDLNPVEIYAATGDISGLTLFSPKQTQVIAGQDITDIGLFLQNNTSGDISLVQAGRDLIAYDAASPLREQAGTNLLGYIAQFEPHGEGEGAPNSGDIQIAGPGSLEVLAGGNLTLGNDDGQNPNNSNPGNGLFAGLVSIGNERNPNLPFGGANVVSAAGLGTTPPTYSAFIAQFLNPSSPESATYLPDLGAAMGLAGSSDDQIWNQFEALPANQQDTYALDVFYLALRDSGRAVTSSGAATSGSAAGGYDLGHAAIAALFPSSGTYSGAIDLTSREIKTNNGGDINLLVPGGQLTVGINLPSGQAVDQGILTVDGGNINIFAEGNVNVGTSRIFTLHGGNEVIWSTTGDIDAGASSKTVLSAPPTRVIVDPTSGDVEIDLAGLYTGGGIGVLATVAGAPPGDVDLIAPNGTVDAGDAGIRASGNLNIAALRVLNASNISVGGKSTGVPTTTSVNIGSLAAASAAAGSSNAAASSGASGEHQNQANNGSQDIPSIISVEVLGYGGGETD